MKKKKRLTSAVLFMPICLERLRWGGHLMILPSPFRPLSCTLTHSHTGQQHRRRSGGGHGSFACRSTDSHPVQAGVPLHPVSSRLGSNIHPPRGGYWRKATKKELWICHPRLLAFSLFSQRLVGLVVVPGQLPCCCVCAAHSNCTQRTFQHPSTMTEGVTAILPLFGFGAPSAGASQGTRRRENHPGEVDPAGHWNSAMGANEVEEQTNAHGGKTEKIG